MKIIQSHTEEVKYNGSVQEVYRAVEFAARVCTNTTDMMSNDSEKWVKDHIISTKHGRAQEFGTIYLTIPHPNKFAPGVPFWLINNHWTEVVLDNENAYVTTNLRVIEENKEYDSYKFWYDNASECTHHARRRTLLTTCSRGIADELRTHISVSTLMESTRYCKYSSPRNGGELVFVEPTWLSEDYSSSYLIDHWVATENNYLALIEAGAKAEMAREVLPLSVKTRVIQCAFENDWKHLFELRAKCTQDNKPHPDMLKIAQEMREVLFGVI